MKIDLKRVGIYTEIDLTPLWSPEWTVKFNIHTSYGGRWSVISATVGVSRLVSSRVITLQGLIELVELNFFASFTTDDQSIFNVSNTSKSSRWTFQLICPVGNFSDSHFWPYISIVLYGGKMLQFVLVLASQSICLILES